MQTSARRGASSLALGEEDNAFDLDAFEGNLRINVISLTDEAMEFDLIGVDVSFANALRRILLAEVPTVAIESVFIADNTSLIADEVLSHRLGLIPLAIDPRLLVERGDDYANETNTVVFRLRAECVKDAEGGVTGDKVLSSALEWLPNGSDFAVERGDPKNGRPAHTQGQEDPNEIAAATYTAFSGSQKDMFPGGVRAVHQDILIAKLSPGQRIDLEGHAVKGVGKDHAKWSPVATAHYRMLPEVVLSEEVVDGLALELTAKCSAFDVKEEGGKKVRTETRPRPAPGGAHPGADAAPSCVDANLAVDAGRGGGGSPIEQPHGEGAQPTERPGVGGSHRNQPRQGPLCVYD